MKTQEQAIEELAISPIYEPAVPRFGSDYHRALAAIFGDDAYNGHTLVKARRDLLKAVERAKDYPARAALIEAKRERRELASGDTMTT